MLHFLFNITKLTFFTNAHEIVEVHLAPKLNHNNLNFEFIMQLEWNIIVYGNSTKTISWKHCLTDSGCDFFFCAHGFKSVSPIVPIHSEKFCTKNLSLIFSHNVLSYLDNV